jgi:hypothetical protein
MKELLLSATMVAALVLPAFAQVEPLPDSILGGWCLLPVGSTGRLGNILLYQREESQDECHTSWLHFTKDGYYGQDGNSGPSETCTVTAIKADIPDHYAIWSRCYNYDDKESTWLDKIVVYFSKDALFIKNMNICLQYEDTVTLTGTITMRKAEFVGHPSDGLPYAVLTLDNPICVSGRNEETENDVTAISLGRERTYPHKFQATVTGRIWHAFTLWHRMGPVMMEVLQIKKR